MKKLNLKQHYKLNMLQINFFVVKNNDQHIISKCKYSLKMDFKAEHFNIVLYSFIFLYEYFYFIISRISGSKQPDCEQRTP